MYLVECTTLGTYIGANKSIIYMFHNVSDAYNSWKFKQPGLGKALA